MHLDESDDDEMEGVEITKSKKLRDLKDLEIEAELLEQGTKKKLRAIKEFEHTFALAKKEAEQKSRELKALQAANDRLQSKIEQDKANLNNEHERVRLELVGKNFALTKEFKEEEEKLAHQHREMIQGLSGEQEAEKQRLMQDLRVTMDIEYKRQQVELQAKANAELQRLNDEHVKKTQLLTAKTPVTKDDIAPQVGIIRNRKLNSPGIKHSQSSKLTPSTKPTQSNKLTVTKSNVGTRTLSKQAKTIVVPNPKAKSNVISTTSPMEQDYNPTTDDDGLRFIWKGNSETGEAMKNVQNVAYNGLKLVSETAAQYVSDTAAHLIPYYAEKPKKSQVQGILEQKVIGDPAFFADDEYADEKEFDTIPLNG